MLAWASHSAYELKVMQASDAEVNCFYWEYSGVFDAWIKFPARESLLLL